VNSYLWKVSTTRLAGCVLAFAVAACIHHPPSESEVGGAADPDSGGRRLSASEGWVTGTVLGLGQRTPVVLIHGLGGNHHFFDAQLQHLRGQRKVVAYDQRGCGGSSLTPHKRYDVDVLAQDLAAVLSAGKGDPVVLVGHSLGADVVIRYAAAHQDRVAALLLLDPPLEVRQGVRALQSALGGTDEPKFREGMEAFFVRLLAESRVTTRQVVLDSLRATPREVLDGMLDGLAVYDPMPDLMMYPGPIWVLASSAPPPALERAGTRFRVEVVPDSSHWLMLDRPEVVNRALDELLASLP
jgi:pimeloyl-ACP methyl ester carboxylesterase